MKGEGHNTETPECWCGPVHYTVCPGCNGNPPLIGCFWCDGTGLVRTYNLGDAEVTVHNEKAVGN